MKKKIILLPLSVLLLTSLAGCDFLKNSNVNFADLLNPLKWFHNNENQNEKIDDKIDNTETNEPHIVEIVVSGDASCLVSKTAQLTVDVKMIGDLDKTVIWSSEDENIATVDKTGLVSGIKEGQTKIFATSTIDASIKGEINFIVYEPTIIKIDATDSTPKYPYYMKMNESYKDFSLSLTVSDGAKLEDIPLEKRIFTWNTDIDGIIDFEVLKNKETKTCRVTPKNLGTVKLTATYELNRDIKLDFIIKVIDVAEGDYFWQFKKDDRAQFGYNSKDLPQGTSEGVAKLNDVEWAYKREPEAKSINTSVSGSMGFGKGTNESEPNNAEDVILTARNDKQIERIVVDTASANGLADFSIFVGEKLIHNEKAPKINYNKIDNECKSIDTGVLNEPATGDITLKWDNPVFDPNIHIVDDVSKGPGAIYLKAIRIFYKETHDPHIDILGDNEVYVNHDIELNASFVNSGEIEDTVIWSSSNENVATIDETGKVHGISEGKVVIHATSAIDSSIVGELEIDVKYPEIKSASADPSGPIYLIVGEGDKEFSLSLNFPTGVKAAEIPAEKKLFDWVTDKDDIIDYSITEAGKGATIKIKVSPLNVGEVVLTATNIDNNEIVKSFFFKVIEINQGDYFWQYNSNTDRAQFGYVNKEAPAGTKEGTATLGDLDWEYNRNRVVSLSTANCSLKFGNNTTKEQPENNESLILKNVNTKKISRIIVDTASYNGLATLNIKIGDVQLFDEPKTVEARLANYDCPSIDSSLLATPLTGDIVIEWSNPTYDPTIHDKNLPGPIFLKAIRIMYAD